MASDSAQIIRQVFKGLDENEVAMLHMAAERRSYPGDTVLCHEGELEHTFYIVVDGLLDITQKLPDGGTRRIAECRPGQFFGEMALIDRKPRTATVTTRTATTVLEISEEDFTELLMRNPPVAISILRTLTFNLRVSDQAAIADLTKKNLELARAYADLQAAQAELVAKERLERELEIAAELQQSLLPQVFPPVPGWSFAGRNVPARSIGGDLFDVMRVDNEHVGLLMADVSDKSIHAALFMAVTRTLFLPESRRSRSPREVALAVHRGLLEVSSDNNMFVTAFYGTLNPATGRMRYVRAGQDRPLLFRANDDSFIQLDAQGRFLGMLEDLSLEECEVTLNKGDTLVMYSDGVPDAVNPAGESYGMERLITLARQHRRGTAQDICAAIFDDVYKFRGPADAFDDITVLIAKSHG